MRYIYPSKNEALDTHARVISRWGGASGLRDEGALESALARPQSGYYSDLIAQAAALLESLVMNHPFVDGNKRVAFALTDAFLWANGYQINIDDGQTYQFFIELLDSGLFYFPRLEQWLRAVAEPRPQT